MVITVVRGAAPTKGVINDAKLTVTGFDRIAIISDKKRQTIDAKTEMKGEKAGGDKACGDGCSGCSQYQMLYIEAIMMARSIRWKWNEAGGTTSQKGGLGFKPQF
ncbi:hypothetical protein TELCIR_03256 [Teladorsagia circumcincta]|uniref:Uncharacterized protein n=1 Tax=Teladorsagia circumcincta TaxID=45464 RepID=A0A2G9UWY8_TELCI|nr:hypothetical protein TELCIR_03256 [Teladorsagia circumcincta]